MSEADRGQLAQQVRAMQIIVLALAAGVLMFALTLLLVIRPQPAEGQVLLAYIAVAAAVLSVPAGLIVPRIFSAQQPVSVATYQTKMIVGAAIFEGAAFFNLVTYMIEGQLYSLAVAGVLLVFILMQFPTTRGVEEWIQSRQRRTRDDSAFGPPRT